MLHFAHAHCDQYSFSLFYNEMYFDSALYLRGRELYMYVSNPCCFCKDLFAFRMKDYFIDWWNVLMWSLIAAVFLVQTQLEFVVM